MIVIVSLQAKFHSLNSCNATDKRDDVTVYDQLTGLTFMLVAVPSARTRAAGNSTSDSLAEWHEHTARRKRCRSSSEPSWRPPTAGPGPKANSRPRASAAKLASEALIAS